MTRVYAKKCLTLIIEIIAIVILLKLRESNHCVKKLPKMFNKKCAIRIFSLS